MHLKQQLPNQNTTSRKPQGQFLSQKSAKRLSQIKKNHRGTQAKTYNDRNSKPQQKHRLGMASKVLLGGVLARFYVATTLAPSSAMVYTRHLFNPRVGFLTHQCKFSENIKIERIQRGNNDEDSTARNNSNAEAKENQQVDSGGPSQSQSIRHQLNARVWTDPPAGNQRGKQSY